MLYERIVILKSCVDNEWLYFFYVNGLESHTIGILEKITSLIAGFFFFSDFTTVIRAR